MVLRITSVNITLCCASLLKQPKAAYRRQICIVITHQMTHDWITHMRVSTKKYMHRTVQYIGHGTDLRAGSATQTQHLTTCRQIDPIHTRREQRAGSPGPTRSEFAAPVLVCTRGCGKVDWERAAAGNDVHGARKHSSPIRPCDQPHTPAARRAHRRFGG